MAKIPHHRVKTLCPGRPQCIEQTSQGSSRTTEGLGTHSTGMPPKAKRVTTLTLIISFVLFLVLINIPVSLSLFPCPCPCFLCPCFLVLAHISLSLPLLPCLLVLVSLSLFSCPAIFTWESTGTRRTYTFMPCLNSTMHHAQTPEHHHPLIHPLTHARYELWKVEVDEQLRSSADQERTLQESLGEVLYLL